MNIDEIWDFRNDAVRDVWISKAKRVIDNGSFINWVSTLRRENVPCKMDAEEGWKAGSFNACKKVIFEDGLECIIRLPLPGKTNMENLDEKVAAEVAAMGLVRENTNVPVPIVYAWGSASDNPLGLGPFMLIEFKKGILLDDIITTKDSRLMREDIPQDFIEAIYRQMARIQLELYSIDLDVIGRLPLAPKAGIESSAGGPPLTFKVNGIRQIGGVYTRGKSFDALLLHVLCSNMGPCI
jgi:hypothetical protein